MFLLYLGLALILFVIVLGPRSKVALFWNLRTVRVQPEKPVDELGSSELRALRSKIQQSELSLASPVDGTEKHIRFSSEARPKRTKYCVLYVHGFSATRQEISPIPETIASSLHANYYGTRLTGHGLDGEALANSKPSDWIFDMMEAWSVAHQLGERVIVMSTSTGGTLATWLAQQSEVKPYLAALIMVSPNFEPKHWATPMFLWPWANYWMPLLSGKTRGWEPISEDGAKYWTYRYPMRVIYGLTALVTAVRKSDIESITTPTLFLYCDQDKVVNSRYTDAVVRRWGSPVKHRIAVPARPNDNNHVVSGKIVNPSTTEQFTADILSFIKSHITSK
jgi:esterase/lipase